MKNKLKELDLKLTELAGYMDISRPTLYKFLEMYVEGETADLRKDVQELFDYINRDDVSTKKQVLRFILHKDKSSKGRASPVVIETYDEDPKMKKILKLIKGMSEEEKNHLIKYIELISKGGRE